MVIVLEEELTVTLCPARLITTAAANPAMPAPTTMTLNLRGSIIRFSFFFQDHIIETEHRDRKLYILDLWGL